MDYLESIFASIAYNSAPNLKVQTEPQNKTDHRQLPQRKLGAELTDICFKQPKTNPSIPNSAKQMAGN